MTDHFALAFGTPTTKWGHWFAWHPIVTADRGWRWFSIVNRRRIHKLGHVVGGADQWRQHVVDPAGFPVTSEGIGEPSK